MVSFLILSRLGPRRGTAQVTRDEKPGHLVLGDFGSACRFHAGDRFKAFVGSPFYASPECLQGDYDERADVWSCGVVRLGVGIKVQAPHAIDAMLSPWSRLLDGVNSLGDFHTGPR